MLAIFWSKARALFNTLINANCSIWFGLGFLCENHLDRVWSEMLGCRCGAGEPCACNRSDDIDAGIEVPDASQIISDQN